MSASLVLVLLLAAVASAQAAPSPVSFENKCGNPVKINGILVGVDLDLVLILDLSAEVELWVLGADGHGYSKKFLIPADVKAVVVVYDGVYIKVKVKAVNFILGLVNTLLGFVCLNLKVAL
jgi:hypothetical protein